MDRRMFINQNYLAGNIPDDGCGLDDCECDPVPIDKGYDSGINILQLAKLTLLAFGCAAMIKMTEMHATATRAMASLLAKEEYAIFCAPNNTITNNLKKDGPPANGDSNNCFHQQLAGCLCENKRRTIKMAGS